MKQNSFLSKDTIHFLIAVGFGMGVNMGLVYTGLYIIPLPEGANINNREGLIAALPLMEFRHFVFPFLAHALGTLAGAYYIAKCASVYKPIRAYIIGALFFLGGLLSIVGMPSPIWFTIVDLTLAYFPMAWLGIKLSAKDC